MYVYHISESNIKEESKTLMESGIIPEGHMVGIVIDIRPKECKGKDGNKFTLIEFIIRGADNKRYKKSYSVDFMRKYLNQMNIKINSLKECAVSFRPSGDYNNAAAVGFIGASDEDLCDVSVHYYVNEETSYDDYFEKLGL